MKTLLKGDVVEDWKELQGREGKKDEISGMILVSVLFDYPNNNKIHETVYNQKYDLIFKYLQYEYDYASKFINKKVAFYFLF